MQEINNAQFDSIISAAMDELPEKYIKGLKNVAIVYDDEPSLAQRKKLKLRCNETLFGLYEGIPNTNKPTSESIFSGNPMILPDKITLFKKPLLKNSKNLNDFKAQVKHTLWHEIAHYYGLDHARIHEVETRL